MGYRIKKITIVSFFCVLFFSASTTISVSSDIENIALNKPVIPSGNEFTPGLQTKVSDGVINGEGLFWAASGVPNGVIIDLRETYTVDRIKVNPFGRANATLYYYDSAWNVKYAITSDPNTFLDFANTLKIKGAGLLAGGGISITNGDPGTGLEDEDYQYYEFKFDPVQVRYIRFEVTAGDKDGDSNLDEIEVY